MSCSSAGPTAPDPTEPEVPPVCTPVPAPGMPVATPGLLGEVADVPGVFTLELEPGRGGGCARCAPAAPDTPWLVELPDGGGLPEVPPEAPEVPELVCANVAPLMPSRSVTMQILRMRCFIIDSFRW